MPTIDPRKLPFQFRADGIFKRVRQKVNANVEGMNITLPGVTFRVRPLPLEQSVAREIVIRMKHHRVLNGPECCDDCIDKALESLQTIRGMLVDQQVALRAIPDCTLFILIDFMLIGIKQFLTYEERLRNLPARQGCTAHVGDFWREPEAQQKYRAALEMIRAHLHRCLQQVYEIAGLNPKDMDTAVKYSKQWDLTAYKLPSHLIIHPKPQRKWNPGIKS